MNEEFEYTDQRGGGLQGVWISGRKEAQHEWD